MRGKGQERIKKSRVLCVGVGGLNSPVAMYLAAAGVGVLGLLDSDSVEPSNFHRQILYQDRDSGEKKVQAAEKRLTLYNPTIRIVKHDTRLTDKNADHFMDGYDVVVDGSDNFDTRYAVNQACVHAQRPLVSGAVLRWEGQVTSILPGGHCYACLFPEKPTPESVQNCFEAGVMGMGVGVIGSLMAVETVKILLGLSGSLKNRLWIFDFLTMAFREKLVSPRAQCHVCQ